MSITVVSEQGGDTRPQGVPVATVDGIIQTMRRRAQASRRTGLFLIAVVTLLGLWTSFTFLAKGSGTQMVLTLRFFGSVFDLERKGDVPTTNPDVQSLIDVGLSISSVLIAVFIIQILVGFARYMFRVADHIDSRAAAIQLCKGDPTILKDVVSAMSTEVINFGKLPTTPAESITNTLKELSSSIIALKSK